MSEHIQLTLTPGEAEVTRHIFENVAVVGRPKREMIGDFHNVERVEE